jgi:hypothetical protein
MNHSAIYGANKLIEKLYCLNKTGEYLFRGHADSSWLLMPRVFRKEGLTFLNEKFPISDEFINKWEFV